MTIDGAFRARVLAREFLTGCWLNLGSPVTAEMAGLAGFDWVMLDHEHGPGGEETLLHQLQAVSATPATCFVRIAANEAPRFKRVLDAGAHGVMVPMVDSVDDAKRAVRSMQYPPDGRRGSAFGMAHDDYLPGTPVDKIASARARNILIALIETPGGVAAADEIAALPGVDILWLGHFDLTNFMGIPGQFDHPDYLAAVDRIVAAARRHGKPAGFLALDDDWARRYHAKGFRVMAYGLDSQLLQSALRRGIELLRSL